MRSPRPAPTSSPSIPEAGPHLHRTIQRIKALGKKAGVVAQPRDAGEDARLCARGHRPGAGDERQSRLRRAEIHLRPAQEDRGDRQPHRQGESARSSIEVDGGIDPDNRAAGGRRRRDGAGRRDRGLPRRPGRLRRQYQGASRRRNERRRLGRRARGRQQARPRLAALAPQAVEAAAQARRRAARPCARRAPARRRAARRPLHRRQRDARRSRSSISRADRRERARLPSSCRASPGCATSPPPRRAKRARGSPKRSSAAGCSRTARGSTTPGRPICGANASCSGPPMRPTSCRAATAAIARLCSTRWRAARGISTQAPTRPPRGSTGSPPGAAWSPPACWSRAAFRASRAARRGSRARWPRRSSTMAG